MPEEGDSTMKVYFDVQAWTLDFRVNFCAHIGFLFYFGKRLRNSVLPISKFWVLLKKS